MPKATASFTRPADNTTYAIGDAIANSLTGASVTPMTFTMNMQQGLLVSCDCVVTPASGNLVTTNLDFDLLLFRPVTSIPFAGASYPADNAAMTITAAGFRELVAVFNFSPSKWRSGAGSITSAGATGWQSTAIADVSMIQFDSVDPGTTLIGVLQAKAAWAPGNVANQFDFTLRHGFV